MNTTELREDLHKRIDDMDERLLKAIHTILLLQEEKVEDPIIGYDTEGNPVLASVAKAEYEKIINESNEENSLTISDFRKEVASW
jgi:coenzyme F420-reducing hydrogenase alpha subunit